MVVCALEDGLVGVSGQGGGEVDHGQPQARRLGKVSVLVPGLRASGSLSRHTSAAEGISPRYMGMSDFSASWET